MNTTAWYRRRRRTEYGASMVLFAASISSLLLFTLGAVTVDLGAMYETRREAQTAADMAALAGGTVLRVDPEEACEVALANLELNNPANDDLPEGIDLDALSCGPNGTEVNSVDTDADGTVDTPVVTVTSGLQTSIRVVLPRQEVNFGFGRALGVTDSSVLAGATVALRSTGGIMPFAVPTGCLADGYDWYFSVTTEPPGNRDRTCGPSEGNFGLVNFGGYGGGARDVIENIQNGDHQITNIATDPSDWESAPDDPACTTARGAEYDSGMIGSTPYRANWDNGNAASVTPLQPVPNCIAIQSGLERSALESGLIEYRDPCDGRLALPLGEVSERYFGSCYLDDSRFAEYWIGTEAEIRDGDENTVMASILTSKNFMVLPVVYASRRPNGTGSSTGAGWVPVVDLMGFFIDCDGTSDQTNRSLCPDPFGNVTGQISNLQGYLFPLEAIENGINDGVTVQEYYTGGPSIPVLVEDPLN